MKEISRNELKHKLLENINDYCMLLPFLEESYQCKKCHCYISDTDTETFLCYIKHPDDSITVEMNVADKDTIEIENVILSLVNNGDMDGTVYVLLYKNNNFEKNLKALFDVKCSKTLIDELKNLDIEPVMYRTGNSYCNMKMQEGNFDFGGEFSGHVFFRDKFLGFDDGIYGGLRMCEVLSNSDKKLSEWLENINKYYSTSELKITVSDDKKFGVINSVKEYAKEKGYNFVDIDGVRVEFLDGWALVRASNTGPNVTMRFEANTENRLEEISTEFKNLLDKIVMDLNNE